MSIQIIGYGMVKGTGSETVVVTPPYSHKYFRKIKALSGGNQFVFTDIDNQQVTVLAADYADYVGELIAIRSVETASDCAFTLVY